MKATTKRRDAEAQSQIDAEEAMQERGDWLVDAFMWCVTWSPVLPLVLYCAAVVLTTIGIIIHNFTH